MAVTRFFRTLLGLRLRSAPVEALVQFGNPRPRHPDDAQIIREAVLRSGLTKGRDCDLQFYLASVGDTGLSGDDLRKRGTKMTTDEKAAAGIGFRGIVTHEFVDTLSDKGMFDTADAARIIATIANHSCSTERDLRNAESVGLLVEFTPSNMADGPCEACLPLSSRRMLPAAAPLLPLPECAHPDQCGCMYRTRMTEDGEF